MATATTEMTGTFTQGTGSLTQVQDDLQQLVIFTMARETYGVDINSVNEILRVQDITRMPRTPHFVEGIIDLRGKVIPVVDLRKVFWLPPTKATKDTRIIWVNIAGRHVGMIVDEVTEVLRIPRDSIEPPSTAIKDAAGSNYLQGIAKLENSMVILLELERLLSDDRMRELEQLGSPAWNDTFEAETLETDESCPECGQPLEDTTETTADTGEGVSEKAEQAFAAAKGKTTAEETPAAAEETTQSIEEAETITENEAPKSKTKDSRSAQEEGFVEEVEAVIMETETPVPEEQPADV